MVGRTVIIIKSYRYTIPFCTEIESSRLRFTSLLIISSNFCLIPGKTLAYVLPVVQQLQYRLVRKVRCLIVLPVQELAAQVYKITKTYTAHTKLRVTLLSGAASFEQEQMNLVKKSENEKSNFSFVTHEFILSVHYSGIREAREQSRHRDHHTGTIDRSHKENGWIFSGLSQISCY